MAVGVLQAFAGQGGASGGGADDEPAGHLVRGGPEGIAGALEAEHRVEHVDRHERLAVRGVGRARGRERGHGTGLVDARVDQLALGRFLVGKDQLPVHGQVTLAVRVVDLRGGEERVHAERAGFIRHDRDNAVSEVLVPEQVLEQADERHGGGGLLLPGTALGDLIGCGVGQLHGRMVRPAFGDEAAEGLAAFHEVLDFGGVRAGVVVRGPVGVGLELVVGERDAQVVAEGLEVIEGELLHLVRGVAALEVGAQAVALDRVGQDDGGFALELGRGLVRGVDLVVVVPAALEVPDLVIGQVLDHFLGLRGLAEEVLADERAGLGLVGLVVPVDGLVHDLHERAVRGPWPAGHPTPGPRRP